MWSFGHIINPLLINLIYEDGRIIVRVEFMNRDKGKARENEKNEKTSIIYHGPSSVILCEQAWQMTKALWNLWTGVPLFRPVNFICILSLRWDFYQHILANVTAAKRTTRVHGCRLHHIFYTSPAKDMGTVGYHWGWEWVQTHGTLLISPWAQESDKGGYQLLAEFLRCGAALRMQQVSQSDWKRRNYSRA